MTDKRDPRGIVNFFVRYLVLHVIFLVGLPVSYFADLALIYFFGFMGIFTFFQMLIAITRKFLEKAGSWKIVAFVGAVFSDVAVLWFLGWLVSGISNGPSWGLVTQWLPYHFVAALCAWGLREFFYLLSPRDTATPSASDSIVEHDNSENPSDPEEESDAPKSAPASAEADVDTDTDKQQSVVSGAASSTPHRQAGGTPQPRPRQ